MDIQRFLPNNQYQAALNANAPTALNPFATISDLIADDQTLAEVLTQGNSTNDGQKIVAATGNSAIDLRSWATNGSITISNDAAGKVGNSDYSLGWWEMAPTYSSVGFNTVALSMGAGSGQLTTNYNNNTDLSRLTMQSGAMFFQIIDDSTGRTALIGSTNNTASSPLTANIANMPSYVSAQNCTIAQDVINSVGLGGVGLDVDKNNYVFVPNIETQIGGVISSESGGGLLNLRAFATDNYWSLSSDSGSLAESFVWGGDLNVAVGFQGVGGANQFYVDVNKAEYYVTGGSENHLSLNNTRSKIQNGGIATITSDADPFKIFISDPLLTTTLNATPTTRRAIAMNVGASVVWNAAIDFSTAQAGFTGIVKSSSTAYFNEIAFNGGLAGEMKIVHTPNAADFIATLQAKSGTIAYLSDVQSSDELSEVLANGNTTGANNIIITNGQTIDASAGGGQLNLANGSGIVELTNDSGGYTKAWFYGDSTTAQYGFGSNFWMLTSGSSSVLESNLGASNYVTISNIKAGVFNVSGIAGDASAMKIADTTLARTFPTVSTNTGFAINNAGAVTFNAGVSNSVAIGYTGTVKTNDTLYIEQLAYADGAFELRIKPETILFSDKFQTLQNKTGTIALISDITAAADSIYANDGTLAGGRTVSGGSFRNTMTFNELSSFVASVKGLTAGGPTTDITLGQGFMTLVSDPSPAEGAGFEFNLLNPSNPYIEVRTETGGAGAQISAIEFGAPSAAQTWTLPDASGTVALNTGQVWTAPTNVSIDRTLDADSTTLDEVADVLGTLITDLKTGNILS